MKSPETEPSYPRWEVSAWVTTGPVKCNVKKFQSSTSYPVLAYSNLLYTTVIEIDHMSCAWWFPSRILRFVCASWGSGSFQERYSAVMSRRRRTCSTNCSAFVKSKPSWVAKPQHADTMELLSHNIEFCCPVQLLIFTRLSCKPEKYKLQGSLTSQLGLRFI